MPTVGARPGASSFAVSNDSSLALSAAHFGTTAAFSSGVPGSVKFAKPLAAPSVLASLTSISPIGKTAVGRETNVKLEVNSHSFPPTLVSCSLIVEVAPPSSSASVHERLPLPPWTAADTPFQGPVDDTATVSPFAFTSLPEAVPVHSSDSLPACFAFTATLLKPYSVPFLCWPPSAGENFAFPSTKHLPPDSFPF